MESTAFTSFILASVINMNEGVVGEVLENAEIPVFVSLRQVAPGYMATDSEMAAF